MTSKAPVPGVFGATLRGTYGSRERIDVDGSINLGLGSENALRVYGYTRNQDGFARKSRAVRSVKHFSVYLSRDDDFVSVSEVLEGASEKLLAGATRIHVGGIEKIDA